MQFSKIVSVFMGIWLVSSVASNGSDAPELQILAQAKTSAEYPVLRKIQDLTLELQMLEITVKNRRDAKTEEKITSAMKEIEDRGTQLAEKFKAIRTSQLDELFAMFTVARRYGQSIGIADAEWNELFAALHDGAITAGTLTVHGKAGALNLITLSPLYIGRQYVWNVTLPEFNRKSFWIHARAKARHQGQKNLGLLANSSLEERVGRINAPSADAEKISKEYFNASYGKLYAAFETQRFAILQRVQMARNALQELSKSNNSMGTPEEFSSLYNQLLENLFSYGVDISLSGTGSQRDFAVKGFLFAESPERSQELLRKLKYTPSVGSFNSPSS